MTPPILPWPSLKISIKGLRSKASTIARRSSELSNGGAVWFPKVLRKDYSVGVTVTETALDDPDTLFYENYACGAERNYTGYCSPQLDQMIDRQSIEADENKRRALVWEAERKLAEDRVRPIIFYSRLSTCWQPWVKGFTIIVNSLFNGWRMEDVWLDK